MIVDRRQPRFRQHEIGAHARRKVLLVGGNEPGRQSIGFIDGQEFALRQQVLAKGQHLRQHHDLDVVRVNLIAGQQELMNTLIRVAEIFFDEIVDPRETVGQPCHLQAAGAVNDFQIRQLVRRQREAGQLILRIAQGQPAFLDRRRAQNVVFE